MKKINVLYLSVNPSYYDIEKIAKANYDEAKEFAENDKTGAFAFHEYTIDADKAGEYKYCADGADYGDGSDTLFMWIKVCGE